MAQPASVLQSPTGTDCILLIAGYKHIYGAFYGQLQTEGVALTYPLSGLVKNGSPIRWRMQMEDTL